MPLIKVGLLVKYFENIFSKKIRPFFNTENDFENQNFEIFEEVVDNFRKSDNDMIWIAYLSTYIVSWPIFTKIIEWFLV